MIVLLLIIYYNRAVIRDRVYFIIVDFIFHEDCKAFKAIVKRDI